MAHVLECTDVPLLCTYCSLKHVCGAQTDILICKDMIIRKLGKLVHGPICIGREITTPCTLLHCTLLMEMVKVKMEGIVWMIHLVSIETRILLLLPK